MRINEILKKTGFRFNKRFGQNFITDDAILCKIADGAGITKEDTVVEVGCGAGTLTSALSDRAGKVIGFEIDRSLKPVLSETLAGKDNVSIVFKDAMKTSEEEMEELAGKKFSLVANLPYYITTPIIMKFTEDFKGTEKIVVTVQEEVADRLCAEAGTPEYGAITAGINVVGNAEKIFRIDRKDFFPSPNVDSAVVRITIDRNKFPSVDLSLYRAVVKAAFGNRRKTLVNNLVMNFGLSREAAEKAVREVSDDPSVRGETFSAADFVRLTEILGRGTF
ncbi:MAG TPA: 16S rRNA (adenine(1518)-N(6)/adenine(1519)-N(6))-dimethyltransferase [Clostridiales bacterium]|nr:16S rRNA (adenine(1518)-N(6)/adenine(1519)-N(6))-dimethyltransferase [Clostridiales bacterium]